MKAEITLTPEQQEQVQPLYDKLVQNAHGKPWMSIGQLLDGEFWLSTGHFTIATFTVIDNQAANAVIATFKEQQKRMKEEAPLYQDAVSFNRALSEAME